VKEKVEVNETPSQYSNGKFKKVPISHHKNLLTQRIENNNNSKKKNTWHSMHAKSPKSSSERSPVWFSNNMFNSRQNRIYCCLCVLMWMRTSTSATSSYPHILQPLTRKWFGYDFLSSLNFRGNSPFTFR